MCSFERRPILACAAVKEVLVEVWHRSTLRDGWAVGEFVIMPDHVHFFARSSLVARTRGTWLKMLKSVSSRRIADLVEINVPIWQGDTFDHILRSAESYAEKWNYVRMNPVRKGLVAAPDEWPWQGRIETLTF